MLGELARDRLAYTLRAARHQRYLAAQWEFCSHGICTPHLAEGFGRS